MIARRSFLFDLNRCTGCGACVLACAIENELEWDSGWRWIETFNREHRSELPLYHLSLACNHCEDAPCENSCPALAITTDARTGTVLIDRGRCIGCGYCGWACPYDAPRMDEAAGVMGKCTFCHHRQREGLMPACVQQCPTTALQVIGRDERSRGVSPETVPGFPRADARPSLRVVPLRKHNGGELPPALVPFLWSQEGKKRGPRITLAREWPLWIFTILCSLLVGWLTGRVALDLGLRSLVSPVRSLVPLPVAAAEGVARSLTEGHWIFALVCAMAAAFSARHLGRPGRAWRSLLNLRNSWLSREVFFFSLFAVLSFFYLEIARYGGPQVVDAAWPRFVAVVSLLAVVAGGGLLVSIDRVYRVLQRPPAWWHSAGAGMLAALALAVTLDALVAVAVVLLVQSILYLARRRWIRARRLSPSRKWWDDALRVVAGAVLPLILWSTGSVAAAWVAALLTLAGAAFDRAEFYREAAVSFNAPTSTPSTRG